MVDPTGVAGVVKAYAKPYCLEVVPFPTITSEPVAKCRDAVTVSADSSCRVSAGPDLINNGSYDTEDATVALKLSSDSFGLGEHNVKLSVTDTTGKTDSCSAIVTVVDDRPPSLVCTERASVETDPGKCSALVEYAPPQEEDNCASTLVQLEGYPSGFEFPVGVTHNSFQSTDTSGLQANCSFDITVNDLEPPEISCSELATTIPNDPGYCSALYEYTPPTAVDNCDDEAPVNQVQGPTITIDEFFFPVGTTVNEFQATDLYGNYAMCSFNVEVVDVEPPLLECPSNYITKCGDTKPSDSGMACTADNCGSVHLSHGDLVGVGKHDKCPRTTHREWVAIDSAGNEISCTQEIVEIPFKPDGVTGRAIVVDPYPNDELDSEDIVCAEPDSFANCSEFHAFAFQFIRLCFGHSYVLSVLLHFHSG